MAQIDLDLLAPDTTIPATCILFGADDQSSGPMSVYPLSALWQKLTGSTAFSGDTVTASKPLFDMAQTWNDAAVTFKADVINITDTASNAASLFWDRLLNGTSVASLRKDGLLSASDIKLLATGTITGKGAGSSKLILDEVTGAQFSYGSYSLVNAGNLYYKAAAAYVWALRNSGEQRLASAALFGWSSSGVTADATLDVALAKDAAGVLALRNGMNAQAFNVYNTYTDASNYERGVFSWASNILSIGTAKAGTGSTRGLRFVVGNALALDHSVSTAAVWTFADPIYAYASARTSYFGPVAILGNGGVTLTNTASGVLSAGTATLKASAFTTSPVTVASLPSAATAGAGARMFVTDATATTFMSVVAGGGANKVPVISDGADWLIG